MLVEKTVENKLRIQGRMQISDENTQNALNRALILPGYRTQKMLQIPLKIIDLQHDFKFREDSHL